MTKFEENNEPTWWQTENKAKEGNKPGQLP